MFSFFKKKDNIDNTVKYKHDTLGEFTVILVRDENEYSGPMIKFINSNNKEFFISLKKGMDYHILLNNDDLKKIIIDAKEVLLNSNINVFKEDLASKDSENIQGWFEDYSDLDLDDIFFTSKDSSPLDFEKIVRDNATFVITSVTVDENYNIIKFSTLSKISFLECYLMYEINGGMVQYIQSDIHHE